MNGIESVWATDGPTYDDAVEVLAYADWLEESGKDAEAAVMRWCARTQRRPSQWLYSAGRPLYAWIGVSRSKFISSRGCLRDGLPYCLCKNLSGRKGDLFRAYSTQHQAYLAVQGSARHLVEKAGMHTLVTFHLPEI